MQATGFGGPNPHTSGLFADMTVDGPEIGTLVLVVDRAKNLPNRKTMGKQNPYCAGRLGKEAKRTETDRRGGQTPKWDQELRFTVHESPDYNNLKISVFSEDKKTNDLIGEAWVRLTDVIIPGGGKGDLWQGLNCKGKYAGELRLELTYYDSRPKPETVPESVMGVEDLRQSRGNGSSRVKRRPLPSTTNGGHVTPDTIPSLMAPGRAKHGPREYRTPPRANSMPPEMTLFQSEPVYNAPATDYGHTYGGQAMSMHNTHPNQYYGDRDGYEGAQLMDDHAYGETEQLDFLPQLPPSSRQRGSLPPQPRYNSRQAQPGPQPRLPPHIGLQHSQSSPAVPSTNRDVMTYDDSYQLHTDYPEPIPDLDYQHQQLAARPRRDDIAPRWEAEYEDLYEGRQPYGQEQRDLPPPPPMHSISAPAVPRASSAYTQPSSTPPSAHGRTPPNGRHQSVPNSSPLQSIERSYGTPQRTPVHGYPSRGTSIDGYSPSPEQYAIDSPSNYMQSQTPSQHSRPQPAPRPLANRHSIADPYHTTPPRPHPLSQEVPRSRSPQPHHMQQYPGSSPQPRDHSPNQLEYRSRDALPLIKPRAISPQAPLPPGQSNSAPRPKSSYNIQFPVRSFESSDHSPLSTSRPSPGMTQPSANTTPQRKSVSPHPSATNSAGASMPFSPDSFNAYNPNARRSTLPNGASPHKPYQIKPGSEAVPREGTSGPIVGWNGKEIDPSDHLPVDSWAPEPEMKVPVKTYGLGRDRDFGPRSANGGVGSGGRSLSKDTVVNVRTRSNTQPQPEPDVSSSRNKLQKKSGHAKGPVVEPLQERHNYNAISVPDPYEQNQYSSGFYQSADRGYNGYGRMSASPTETLSQEISNIDIGSGRHMRTGSVPAPTAYVPVRSHRDRNTFY